MYGWFSSAQASLANLPRKHAQAFLRGHFVDHHVSVLRTTFDRGPFVRSPIAHLGQIADVLTNVLPVLNPFVARRLPNSPSSNYPCFAAHLIAW